MKKKNLWNMLAIMLVAMLSVGFTSCNDDDDDEKGGRLDSVVVGEWQECSSAGVLKNDATDEEVMHAVFRSNKTGDWWSVTKGNEDPHKYSFDYTITTEGNASTITLFITSSTDPLEVGETDSAAISYENGVLHAGELYYKKIK